MGLSYQMGKAAAKFERCDIRRLGGIGGMRRLTILLLALPLLAACNKVYTRRPLVSEAREQGDPEFRPGLWKVGGDGADDPLNCPFDIKKSRRDWPACAAGLELRRGGQLFVVDGHDQIEAGNLRLLDGQPIVMQLHLHTDIFRDPRVPQPKDADNPFYGWTYAAVTVVKTDAAARITEAQLAWADCGPLDRGGPSAGRTDHPFAGLGMVGANCVAKDLDTVKDALAQSAKIGAPVPMRWIRDTP
jgi:hypothetical protein